MSDIALRTVGLGKMYHIGGEREKYRTLRDTIVQAAKRPLERIRHPGAATHVSEDTLGAQGRRSRGRAAARRSASSVATAPARARCSRSSSHITEPTEGSVDDPGTGRQPPRGRHRLPPGAHRSREHLPERRHPRHVARRDQSEVRRDRRVQRDRHVPRHAGEALLERHVRPARVRGGRASRTRDPDRRRGARGGRRELSAEVPRQDGGRRERAGGRSSSSATTWLLYVPCAHDAHSSTQVGSFGLET